MSDVRLVVAAGDYGDLETEKAHIGERPISIRMTPLTTPAEMSRETRDADGVIVTTHPVPRDLIEAMDPGVKIIGRAGIGLDAIDLDAARERGIAVFHTPDYATEEVATHALALILALNRRIVEADAAARSDWDGWVALRPVTVLSELTVGVVGLGRIGQAVVDRLRGFGPRILGFDPYVEAAPDGVELCDFEELLRESDVVTLHVPLTPDTTNLIGKPQLDMLRPGAALVNVSRGGLIDESALLPAVSSGAVRAALDVRAEEPPPAGDPFLNVPELVLTPHYAWYSDSSETRVRTDTIDGVFAFLGSEPILTGRMAVDPGRAAQAR